MATDAPAHRVHDPTGGEKGIVHTPDEDDGLSVSSYEAQAGVKGIEAISQTWTKWALAFAYLGYALDLLMRHALALVRADDGRLLMRRQNFLDGLFHLARRPDRHIYPALRYQRI